jgi:hypothetical protein
LPSQNSQNKPNYFNEGDDAHAEDKAKQSPNVGEEGDPGDNFNNRGNLPFNQKARVILNIFFSL